MVYVLQMRNIYAIVAIGAIYRGNTYMEYIRNIYIYILMYIPMQEPIPRQAP